MCSRAKEQWVGALFFPRREEVASIALSSPAYSERARFCLRVGDFISSVLFFFLVPDVRIFFLVCGVCAWFVIRCIHQQGG